MNPAVETLIEAMRAKSQIREWSRGQMIKELMEKGKGNREADRIIAQAESLGLLDSRQVDKAGRKRYFLAERSGR